MVRRYGAWAGLVFLTACVAALPFLVMFLFQPDLPSTLGPLRLVTLITGDEAKATVNRMHGSRVAGAENLIGLYDGPPGRATLYLSRYATVAAAEADGDAMTARIAAGGGGGAFGHLAETVVEGQPVSICMGLGQVHLFFAKGRSLYWLAADPAVAEQCFRAIIRLPE